MNGLEFVVAPERVIHFMLIATRVGGAITAAPFLGHPSMPRRVRIGVAVTVALAFVGNTPMGTAVQIENPWSLAGALLSEAAIGVMFGFLPQFIFGGVMLGGQMAGIHMGLGLARIVDPFTRIDATPVALWLQFIAMLIFLSFDVHHLVLRAIARSFAISPPGTVQVDAAGISHFLGLTAEVFEIAVRVAAPVLGGLLIVETAMGLLARTIPELNVFIMGFAVKIVVGFLLLGAAAPYVVRFLELRFADLEPALVGLLGSVN